jgi:hypothetical protein
MPLGAPAPAQGGCGGHDRICGCGKAHVCLFYPVDNGLMRGELTTQSTILQNAILRCQA